MPPQLLLAARTECGGRTPTRRRRRAEGPARRCQVSWSQPAQRRQYPATKAGANLPALSKGVAFYGDQKIYDVFAQASTQVTPGFTWGPTMTSTYTNVSDGFKNAVSGKGTLMDGLTAGQASTIQTLKSQAIPVKG